MEINRPRDAPSVLPRSFLAVFISNEGANQNNYGCTIHPDVHCHIAYMDTNAASEKEILLWLHRGTEEHKAAR